MESATGNRFLAKTNMILKTANNTEIMIKGHRIAGFEDVRLFAGRMQSFRPEHIECTSHTFFRLSGKQREIFTCAMLRKWLQEETPVIVSVQNNGCFSAFYKTKEQRYIRIIIDIGSERIRIVTFYIVEKDQLPKGYYEKDTESRRGI